MADRSPQEIIQRYLEDAIAAENHFENQLRMFAKETDSAAVRQVFEMHADESRSQHDRLTARLEQLGGSPSGLKSFLANLFGMAPKTAQIGHDDAEKGTQDLMMAYAVENSEIAMYEAMATAADAAGDTITASLAREIQQEERSAAQKVWGLLQPEALRSFEKVSGQALQRAA